MGRNRPIDKSSGFPIFSFVLYCGTGSGQLGDSVIGLAIVTYLVAGNKKITPHRWGAESPSPFRLRRAGLRWPVPQHLYSHG